jgi:CTP synthase
VLGLADADTAEDNDTTTNPVIEAMQQREMRLGAYTSRLEPGSRIAEAYGTDTISERHRHRYKFNNAYREQFEKAGMRITALSSETTGAPIVEAVEIPAHPWFVAVQFHPEYKSNVKTPHPLFVAFVKAAKERN